MRLFIQLFLASLIIIKIVLGSIFLYRVEFGSLLFEQSAIAAEAEKAPEGASKTPEGASEKDDPIFKEEKIDLDLMLKKKADLKKQEEEIARKREKLLSIQDEVNKKLTALTKLRNEIRAEMAKKEVIEQQKLKHLIKAYSAMKPQKAASLIEKLEIGFSIELLSKMKGDAVGNILSFVNLDKAAKISEALAKRR